MSDLRAYSRDGAYAPAPVASTLLQLWQDGRRLDALSADLRPRTLSEGYDVQDAFVAMSGDMVAGWKLGVGSPAAMRKAGTERALIGRLLGSRCTMVDSCAPPPVVEIVTIAAARPVTVEFEIAFVLGRDVKPGEARGNPMETVDPLTALAHLFDHARERGITLHRGDIVTTGAAASPFDVLAEEFEISARVKSI